MPVDERLRSQLVAAGAADEDATASEISAWISRQIKASDRLVTHFKLQAWIDEVGGYDATKSKKGSSRTKKPGGTKSRGKTSTKKKAAGSAGR